MNNGRRGIVAQRIRVPVQPEVVGSNPAANPESVLDVTQAAAHQSLLRIPNSGLLRRLIARLDIKGPNVVKGVQMEGLRVIGNPRVLATKYANEGADELLYIDCVATLYGRNQLAPLLEETCRDVFIPITVGGGIRSLGDVQRLLRAGADSVAINTAAIRTPSLIRECSDSVGSQAITVSIEAKRTESGWEAYTDNGREKTGRCAKAWAEEAVSLGAGQVLVTSIDRDGTRKGFDVELVRTIKASVDVPVIACGGMGTIEHLREVLEVKPNGVALASALHYGNVTFEQLREGLQ